MSDFFIDISENRKERFKDVASLRQLDLTVLLENVHDLHNIGAVLRSCDSVGIDEVYILDTDPRLIGRKITDNKSSSTGINKWMNIHRFDDMESCMDTIKSKYSRIIGTVLGKESISLYDFDYVGSTALVFGNEKEGITPQLQKFLDANMLIPQVGFAQSLNISVACAVTLYEVFRQRLSAGLYVPKEADNILKRYRQINEIGKLNKAK